MSLSQKIPLPQGHYRPFARHGNIVYTSGMTPRLDGKLLYSGQIKYSDPLEEHREAVRLATQNALVAARASLQDNEQVTVVLQLQVFLNAEPDFIDHSKIADFASEYLAEELGETGIGSRAAIGVGSLPSGATVEVTITAAISTE